MVKKEPFVYIIIINYNNWKDTIECIESLKKITYKNFKIIIVDNHSNNDSVNQIKNKFPNIQLIKNNINSGFAGGNNIGVKIALNDNPDYILLLNNDTIVDKNFLQPLVELAETDDNIGVVGGKIYFYDRPNVIWFAGAKVNKFTGRTHHIGYMQNDIGQYDKVKDSEYISGCLMLIKANVIKNVGLMDESYFLYYEETDWNIRIRKAGYKILFTPYSNIYHKVSASTKNINYVMLYYFDRNCVYFIDKNYGLISKIFINIYISVRLMLRILKAFINNDKEKIRISLKTIKSINKKEMGKYIDQC